MKALISFGAKQFSVDLSAPIDLSIPIMQGEKNVNAFYIAPVTYIPFQAGSFVGDVNQGGSCNVNTITINPHGNGTHTETVGHISKEKYPIRNSLSTFFFFAKVITLTPEKINNDLVMTLDQLKNVQIENAEALVIRTLPNSEEKKTRQYSGTNPAYMTAEAALYLREAGIKHLLLDVPSIDKEDDGGKLSAHHAFWNYPTAPRKDCTITELIFVDEKIADGFYLLELQYAAFDNDASPSRPILYGLI
ncbi:MAG: cyclase family protein [Bacteroidetes bacterium]|nr:cyclase family protein [Bacteroidota bacterium]MBK8362790.1 cyclase family protein [Bacteroidota bacterium]MBK9413863.1 cyclase family protein [Bacteroidota bacterium]MBP6657016.1 cyclase family protein [Bacteroidia bacterium]